jgi:hypothetical protein
MPDECNGDVSPTDKEKTPYVPLPSTGEELIAYFKNAGFVSVRVEIESEDHSPQRLP